MQAKLAAVLARDADGDQSLPVAVVCRNLGISRQTYYKYRRRFLVEGLDGLQERSRRPHGSPTRFGVEVEEAIIAARKDLDEQGWDCGAISIRTRLLCDGLLCDPQMRTPSLRTIHRVLLRRGLCEPTPAKRTRSSYRRFEFPATDDCWQIDAFEHTLTHGEKVVIFEVIDDHSRFLVASMAWPSEDGAGAWLAVSSAISRYGRPRMLLSDNSLAFSGARRRRRVEFEANLQTMSIKAITSRPYHPTTCGKNERHHQTSQRWLGKQPPAAILPELQAQLDTYRHAYNTQRLHQGIGLHTPADRRDAGRRATSEPTSLTAHPDTAPTTVITDLKVNSRGQIHLTGVGIGLGSKWAGCTVTTFTTGSDQVLVFYRDELVRELTIDRTRTFQPTGQPRGGTRHTRITDTVN
jgi:transposase InsO family protein